MENTQKKVYEKPDFQEITLEFEASLLSGSPDSPVTTKYSPAYYGRGLN